MPTNVNRSFVGYADPTIVSKQITSAKVYVLNYMANQSAHPTIVAPDYFNKSLWVIALHELGHVLGLGHYSNDFDLMSPSYGDVTFGLPNPNFSTLDLYAVHILASGSAPESVTLPQNISYSIIQITAIPEFPNAAAVFVLVTIFVFLQLTPRERLRPSRRKVDYC